ncbi:MAG: GH3 auxin-responsive promoter family protein, partial [Mastigocoleus sp. MO_167.B18]|nr:GH3 auxin-responsive promoter family protein [Mastigocoleus sp. MO_167.B18]
MTNLFLSIITAATKVTKANFVTKTRQVEAVQEEFLLSLLKAYQNTEFAKKYKLQEIKNVEQFRNLIPILAYSSYEVFVERITKGENNILTPDPVVHLNRSSGSTGKQKLIPVTKRSRQILNR